MQGLFCLETHGDSDQIVPVNLSGSFLQETLLGFNLLRLILGQMGTVRVPCWQWYSVYANVLRFEASLHPFSRLFD